MKTNFLSFVLMLFLGSFSFAQEVNFAEGANHPGSIDTNYYIENIQPFWNYVQMRALGENGWYATRYYWVAPVSTLRVNASEFGLNMGLGLNARSLNSNILTIRRDIRMASGATTSSYGVRAASYSELPPCNMAGGVHTFLLITNPDLNSGTPTYFAYSAGGTVSPSVEIKPFERKTIYVPNGWSSVSVFHHQWGRRLTVEKVQYNANFSAAQLCK